MSPVALKTETVGVDPKVPVAALGTVIGYLLFRLFGIEDDVSDLVQVILSVLFGGGAAALGPAAKTRASRA